MDESYSSGKGAPREVWGQGQDGMFRLKREECS